jgi:signal transduction histidine kinase
MSNAIYLLKLKLSTADQDTREYLEIIGNEIDNSTRIISDLLDFARTKNPQTKTVKADALIESSLKRCAIPETVSVRTDIPQALPQLWVDPQQIEQVLQNLISNAIQAMPEGGVVRVAARVGAAPCGCPPEDAHMGTPLRGFIEISVADTGEGISGENMKKLFQPLFTTKANGIGLGLVVCKNLVEANRGRIEVESEPGNGTVFTLLLPMDVGKNDE